MTAIFKKYLNLFAILWLAINVAIASVPRCDSLLSFLKIHSHDASAALSCHEDASHDPAVKSSNPGQTKISAYDLCPCSISTFAYAVLKFENPSDFIVVKSIVFAPDTQLPPHYYLNYSPAIEPPYPKFSQAPFLIS